MKKTILVCGVFLAACSDDTQTPEVFEARVIDSVAMQALGEGAISVYPFVRNNLEAPGIYHVKFDNAAGRHSFWRICQRDMNIPAIKDMKKKEPRKTPKTYTDYATGANVRVSLPYFTASTKYTLQTVEGFEANELDGNQTNFDLADHILRSVDDECRNEVLPLHKPYFVVVGTARSDSIDVETSGGVNIVPFNVGIASVEVKVSQEGKRSANEDRVFAISGKYFPVEGDPVRYGNF